MNVEFDPDKDEANRRKHRISLASAAAMDFDATQVIADERRDYGEPRFRALGPIRGRLHVLVFTITGRTLRAVSLRKANLRGGGFMGGDTDNPEWTDDDFARAKPFREMFPTQHEAWKRRGRPPAAAPKVHIGFRLAADVVEGIRATGRGYNARVEKVLREALAKGDL